MKMTRRIVRAHVRVVEIFDNKNGGLKCPYLMNRRKSKTGGIKHTCPVVKLESKSGVCKGPHLLIRRKPHSNLFNLLPPMPMQLMNTPCHSGERPESTVPDRLWDWWNGDQQRQWLQVQPWNDADPCDCGLSHWKSTESQLGSVESLECQ